MRWLRLLTPYVAVGIFWVGYSHAWLAILAYHLQIILWHRFGRWVRTREQENRIARYVSFVCVLAGPVVYFFLPRIALVAPAQWLAHYRLDGAAFILMIPYFGIVHPILEQYHWHRLRSETGWAHICFAGYHVMVLYGFLPLGWLMLCLGGLMAISWIWKQAGNTAGSRASCMLTHILADLGVILAVFWLIYM